MKSKIYHILVTALFMTMGTALFGQVQQKLNAPADVEMQAEMKKYMEELKLTPEQIARTGQTLAWKMEEKQRIYDLIEDLKTQLSNIDLNADKQIMETLTEEQKQIFVDRIQPEFKANRENAVEKATK